MSIPRNLSFLAEGASATGVLGVTNGGTGATTLTSGYLVKGNGTSAVSASVVYDTGTNVGIGTASPATLLDVNGTAHFRADGSTMLIESTQPTNQSTLKIIQCSTGGNGNTDQGLVVQTQAADGTSNIAHFYDYNSGSPVSRVRFLKNGVTCFQNTVCSPTFAGSAVRGSSNLDLNGNSGYLTLRTGDATRLFVGSTGGVSVGAVTDPGLYNFIVAGTVSVNGVIAKSIGGTMTSNTATYFDFPTYDDAGNGQMLEVKAFFDHYYNFDYGTHLYRFVISRDTSTCNLTIFNCTSVNGGSWVVYKTSSTNLRVCKIGGTYGGGGAYWIQVTGKQP